MADATGNPRHALMQSLTDADFFWALRVLQTERSAATRIGETVRLEDDWLRVRQAPHYTSSAGPIEKFVPGEDGEPDEVFVRFFGLFGPNGGLPLNVTEIAADRRLHAKDETLWRFVDVFHHRMLTLFFRAWATHRLTVDLERGSGARYPFWLGSLFGLGQTGLRDRDHWDDFSKLFHAGQLVRPTRNAAGLEDILCDFFGVPAKIESFVGQWVPLPEGSRSALGADPRTGGLGRSTYLGEKLWDRQAKFRVRLGPLGRADFDRFLPSDSACAKLRDIVRFFVGFELAWDVQCVLRAAEVPATQLGAGGRLGWTTWLKTKPFSRDAGDLIINLEAQAA